jgi:hypothetical protein
MWAKLPGLIDKGTVVQSAADPRTLIFYQKIEGTTYRAEVAVRDVTPQGVRIKGGRLELQFFREIEDEIARHELMIAGEKRILRRALEVPKPKAPPKPKPPPLPVVHAPSLKLPADGLGAADMSLAEDRAIQAATPRRASEALGYYAGPGYRDINRALRAKEPLGTPASDDAVFFGKPGVSVRLIDEAMNSSLPLPADIVLYRSISMTPAELKRIQPGYRFTELAYASTSRWRRRAEAWRTTDLERSEQVVYVINAGGSKGLPLYHIDQIAISSEGEVLLPRNLDFEVTKIEEGKGPPTSSGGQMKPRKLTRVYVNIVKKQP